MSGADTDHEERLNMSVDTGAPEAQEQERLPLEMYQGKRIILSYKHAITKAVVERAEGTADTASALALLFKPKGRAQAELVLPEDILSIELDDSKTADLKQKTLKDVTLSTVRSHLADRHGWALADVNELDEEAAMRAHRDLDHSPLAHKHAEAEAAEAEADGEEPDEDDLDEDDIEDDSED